MDDCITKACSKCGVVYPRTLEFFYKEKTHRDGMHNQCKTCHKLQNRQWALDNPDKTAAIKQAYYDKNRTLVIARSIKWQQEHPEEKRIIYRKFYQKHITDERHRSRLKRLTNPGLNKIYKSRRRARLRLVGGSFSKADIARQYKIQNGNCWWNSKHKLGANYHIDHLIPLARGGHNWPSNIVLACPQCNQSKHDKMPHEWAGRLL